MAKNELGETRSFVYSYPTAQGGHPTKEAELNKLCEEGWIITEQKVSHHGQKSEHPDPYQGASGKRGMVKQETSYTTVSVVLAKLAGRPKRR